MIDPAQLASVLDDLGLEPVGDNWFVGQVYGVPLALNVALTDIALTLLFQVRYPPKDLPSENPPIPPEFVLAAMAAEKRAEISLTRTSAWLTLSDSNRSPTIEQVRGMLKEFFAVLNNQGVSAEKRLCVACGTREIDRPGFNDGRLELICDPCRNEAEAKFRRESSFNSSQLPFLLITGALFALVGAIIWGGVWYGFDWVLQKQSSDRVYIPVAVIALLAIGAGCVVPQPLLYYISRVRNRGFHFAPWFAVACTLVALALGELFFTAALFVETLDAIPPPTLLPQLWLSILGEMSGSMHLAAKIIGAGAALFLAYKQALPRKPGV